MDWRECSVLSCLECREIPLLSNVDKELSTICHWPETIVHCGKQSTLKKKSSYWVAELKNLFCKLCWVVLPRSPWCCSVKEWWFRLTSLCWDKLVARWQHLRVHCIQSWLLSTADRYTVADCSSKEHLRKIRMEGKSRWLSFMKTGSLCLSSLSAQTVLGRC